ncbi:hypothetical protein SSS_00651 [Sarcoptes scabiei]|uniref:Uncharacterized protein n=1 Tax=Sarcoptes scabiei TaxID=52283 RepID=A0A834VAA7_SARSC|nr:hypothetical protein SSS_00651 [Sarcoptes scabiei]UXI14281.1 hypothetical protein NH340_JMT00224 [Sarcoptes scabiei]
MRKQSNKLELSTKDEDQEDDINITSSTSELLKTANTTVKMTIFFRKDSSLPDIEFSDCEQSRSSSSSLGGSFTLRKSPQRPQIVLRSKSRDKQRKSFHNQQIERDAMIESKQLESQNQKSSLP